MVEQGWRQRILILRWVLLDNLKRLFTENKLLKLISLAIASVMWFAISTQQEQDRTLENIQLQIKNRRDDTMVTNVPMKVVDLRVRGPRSVVMDLTREKVKVVIDATDLTPANHVVWLKPLDVTLPPHIEVLRIDPPSIPLVIESRISRMIPVKPVIDLKKLAPNQVVAETLANPAAVEVHGPASLVNQIEQVMTQPIDPSSFGLYTTLSTELSLPEPQTTVSPSQVNVTVHLDDVIERTFPDLKPVVTPKNRSRSAQRMNVTLKGPRGLLDKISPADIIVKLDVTKELGTDLNPTIELPERFRESISIVSIKPEK